MSTQTVVSVAKYLSTCYRPDREYLDGMAWSVPDIAVPFAEIFKA